MIILRHESAGASTAALKCFSESLGVEPSHVREVEAPAELNAKTESTSLAAPFCWLPALLGRGSDAALSTLRLPRSVRRVLFHSYDPDLCPVNTIRELMQDPTAELTVFGTRPVECILARETQDVCGPLTGLSIRASDSTHIWGLRAGSGADSERVISVKDTALLLRLNLEGREVYLLFASTLADPEKLLRKNLDVRECLFSVVAPMMALRCLTRGKGWTSDNRFANVIIDDPPLRARYGFIDFKRLAQRLMDQNLSFTLAFIPWNFRRGGRAAAQLFKGASERLGLCVHGCNHTLSEFGGTDQVRLSALASLACERMDALTRRTGVGYQRIMVFPQGVLSGEAMLALKENNYLAAVNTEVLDAAGNQPLTLRDVLQPAVTAYHGFPLFLRRKVEDGIENIAFDLFTGKPAIVVTHHDDYYSDDAPIWRLTEALDALVMAPQWRPLADVLANTVGYRKRPERLAEVMTYANTTRLFELPKSWHGRPLSVIKHEPEPDMILQVIGSGSRGTWKISGGDINVPLDAGWEGGDVSVVYKGQEDASQISFGLKEKFDIGVRRSLSEFRDNYVTTSPILRRLLTAMRH